MAVKYLGQYGTEEQVTVIHIVYIWKEEPCYIKEERKQQSKRIKVNMIIILSDSTDAKDQKKRRRKVIRVKPKNYPLYLLCIFESNG